MINSSLESRGMDFEQRGTRLVYRGGSRWKDAKINLKVLILARFRSEDDGEEWRRAVEELERMLRSSEIVDDVSVELLTSRLSRKRVEEIAEASRVRRRWKSSPDGSSVDGLSNDTGNTGSAP